jgi:hypothetical protein
MLNSINGIEIYSGPSQIDGKPIVCVATGLLQAKPSSNRKTGAMVQTWIFRSDQHPAEIAKKQEDFSVCGNCTARRSLGGHCYVLPFTYGNIYKAYKKGKYVPLDQDNVILFNDTLLRCGSFGNPSALPYEIWEPLLKRVKGHTAYDHRWNDPKIDPRFKLFCMASVESEEEIKAAQDLGWRCFYTRKPNAAIPKGFHECGASEEQGKKLNCARCLSCDGADPKKPRKGSVTILAHGVLKKRFNEYKNPVSSIQLTVGVT